jgi:hypothetical protein
MVGPDHPATTAETGEEEETSPMTPETEATPEIANTAEEDHPRIAKTAETRDLDHQLRDAEDPSAQRTEKNTDLIPRIAEGKRASVVTETRGPVA